MHDEYGIKAVMDEMPYGLYIIGSRAGDDVNGMMADWVMQVAFEPRLVAVSFENDSHTLANVRQSNVFTVNMLSQDDDSMELARRFAQPTEGSKVKGRSQEEAAKIHHKFETIEHDESPRGCPVLREAMAWLECEVDQMVPVGGHTLVVGRVVDGRLVRGGSEPLTSNYTGWTYSG